MTLSENRQGYEAVKFRFLNPSDLHVTRAMDAGLADHVWSLEEPVGPLDRTVVIAA